jgi:murein DD-endopeptidase MepM/ murein hydrolase activator NlpD
MRLRLGKRLGILPRLLATGINGWLRHTIVATLACAALLGNVSLAQNPLAAGRSIMTTNPTGSGGVLQLKTGVVDKDLFASISLAGVPDDVSLTMVRELSQIIHLNEAIKTGDRFALLFEKPLIAGLGAAGGKSKLLAFEYSRDVAVYTAFWFERGTQSGFFQEDGVSLRPAYLRTPVEIVRVSSHFGGRMHPLRKTWLTHEGTDFAAPTGTRVFASGDGEVAFVGTQNGFGKVIKLKHPMDTQTVYAHLSAFTPSLKVGDSIKQGDVIGAVGATGWATGPHLHYEYRVGNKPIDPFSAAVPVSNRIAAADAERFEAQMNQLKAHFSLIRKPVSVEAPPALGGRQVASMGGSVANPNARSAAE